jgi:hypothetical protein
VWGKGKSLKRKPRSKIAQYGLSLCWLFICLGINLVFFDWQCCDAISNLISSCFIPQISLRQPVSPESHGGEPALAAE